MKAAKHLIWIVLAIALFLTGCGANDASTETKGEEKKTPTPEEILEKSFEADADMKSADIDMNMKMDINAPGVDQSTTSSISGTIVMKPSISMKLNMDTMGEQVESYIKEDTLYLYEPTTAAWYKMDADSETSAALDPKQYEQPIGSQIKTVQKMADSIKVSETDTDYVLDVKIAEDKMKDIMEEKMGASYEDIVALEDVSYDKFDYTITIDKETNYFKNYKIDMVMKATQAGEEGTVNAVIDVNTSNFNGTDAIELPEEVKDAIDITEEAGMAY
ncbi:hypothetical protein SAMN05421503_3553 [Terribacillus aidingensis]|uniref:Outer membrane lipoprotein-sorting protein n=1 Tax=Terribacillus aidingensis TaxID=586416 RepID=A0A285PAN0_9BACI|nr:DUF6612 family protein [Terribacillus aidingensis]SNZ18283.1 hypothetical protein SAMN05421503_3553 [Terribacillus aidingensis]